jgi:hypothetical protein
LWVIFALLDLDPDPLPCRQKWLADKKEKLKTFQVLYVLFGRLEASIAWKTLIEAKE